MDTLERIPTSTPTTHSQPAPHCPHCASGMEIGYVPESTEVGIGASVWVAGEAENSHSHEMFVRGQRRYPITAYRCTGCGYVAFFAK